MIYLSASLRLALVRHFEALQALGFLIYDAFGEIVEPGDFLLAAQTCQRISLIRHAGTDRERIYRGVRIMPPEVVV